MRGAAGSRTTAHGITLAVLALVLIQFGKAATQPTRRACLTPPGFRGRIPCGKMLRFAARLPHACAGSEKLQMGVSRIVAQGRAAARIRRQVRSHQGDRIVGAFDSELDAATGAGAGSFLNKPVARRLLLRHIAEYPRATG